MQYNKRKIKRILRRNSYYTRQKPYFITSDKRNHSPKRKSTTSNLKHNRPPRRSIITATAGHATERKGIDCISNCALQFVSLIKSVYRHRYHIFIHVCVCVCALEHSWCAIGGQNVQL